LRAVEALVETLASCGIGHVFGLPGNSLLEATDYMIKSGKVEFVTVRHEQVAAAMAEGMARVTGKPGVCMAGAGPSAANLVIGVANAYRASSPLLVLTGNLPRSKLGRGVYNEWNQMEVFKPITKLSFQITVPHLLVNQIKLGLMSTISGRPGPVHVDIPYEVGLAEVERGPKPNSLSLEPTRLPPRQEDLSKLIELVEYSLGPVILAGGGAASSGSEKNLLKFIELLGIPVVLTSTSRGLISEEHPLCFGGAGVWGYQAANDLVRSADLVLALGCRFSDDATIDWTTVPKDAKVIQVDIDPSELGKQFDLDLGIHADVNTFLRDILRLVRRPGEKWANGRLKSLQGALRDQREEFYTAKTDETPIDKRVIIREVSKRARRDVIVMSGTGVHARYVSRFLAREPRCLHKSGSFAAMGFAFPAAMGAKLAFPDRQVICLDGDGDFMMTVQDLETAVRMNLPVVTVVFNNQSYAAYEPPPKGGRKSVEFRNPDFVKLAESFGAVGLDVTRSSEFGLTLEKMLKEDRPSIINAVVSSESELALWPTGKP